MSANRIYDRIPNFAGGQDSYKYAAELAPNQSQLLQNMVVLDNGRAVTRPGADQINSTPSTFGNINPVGQVQGLAFLDNYTYGQNLLMAQGGKLYNWNGSGWSNALAFTLTTTTNQIAAVQGVDKLLISDGAKAIQLWNGNAFTACSTGPADTTATNGPTGATSVAFIAGMFVCAGPAMVQGNGATVTTYPPDSLVFSGYLGGAQGTWSNAYQFRVGNGDGEAIVALAPIQSTATSTPIYNLAVLKENSVWILNIQPGAYATFAGMFTAFSAAPQGDQVGTGIGCVGKNAWCVFQNDLLFMSQDGVQSLQRMQAAAGQYQLTSPLSLPIQPYIDRINWNAASKIQAIKYRQLALFFVPLDGSATNNWVFVWNGRISQWTVFNGWSTQAAVITRFPQGVNFVAGGNNGQTQGGIQLVLGNADGSVNVWKDSSSLAYLDNTYLDNTIPIPWQVNTRAMIFGNLDFQKKLRACLIRFNQGHAAVNLSAYLDLADSDDWNQALNPGGAVLPVILPFVLATSKPTPCYRSLEGLPYANEFYLQIGSAGGWADIRGIVASAFDKPFRNPSA